MMLYLYLECAVSVPERDVEFFSDTLVLEPGKIKSFAVTSTDLGLSYLKTNTGCNKVQWNYMHNTKHDYVGQEVATHLDIVYEMISSKKKNPTKQMGSESARKARKGPYHCNKIDERWNGIMTENSIENHLIRAIKFTFIFQDK